MWQLCSIMNCTFTRHTLCITSHQSNFAISSTSQVLVKSMVCFWSSGCISAFLKNSNAGWDCLHLLQQSQKVTLFSSFKALKTSSVLPLQLLFSLDLSDHLWSMPLRCMGLHSCKAFKHCDVKGWS